VIGGFLVSVTIIQGKELALVGQSYVPRVHLTPPALFVIGLHAWTLAVFPYTVQYEPHSMWTRVYLAMFEEN
jgi:hypothetical protein